jgi:digeranylgeranylglycerophospholipid reductase
MYDLIVVGAGPTGLMAARTAARDGLKVLLVERRKKINPVKRFCSQMIRVGDQGFSSAKKPTDIEVNPVTVTFEITEKHHKISLNNLDEEVTVDYRGPLRTYHNETWISPSGHFFNTLESNETFFGFQLDKGELLAGLLDECVREGCEYRSETKCVDIEDNKGEVSVRLSSGGAEETLKARRAVLADGAVSSLMGKLGFNDNRPDAGPKIKLLAYMLDRVDSPFPESCHIDLCVPSLYPANVPLGLWAYDTYQLIIAMPVFMGTNLPDLMKKFMKESPFASWFASSKIVERQGCNMILRTPIWEPAKGNVICCGDNASLAEVAIKGGFGCGYKAAKAIGASLEGGDGNSQYNSFWQKAFYFHSPQYRSIGKRIYPPARVLDDAEIDTLFKWIGDNKLWGLPNDVLLDNIEQIREELPEIAEKLTP